MHFLIINAGIRNPYGTLSLELVNRARATLESLGHTIEVTDLNNEYDRIAEAQKMLQADVVIVQTPGWWMSTPWQFKKYQDEVFVSPIVCGGDGRSRANPSKRYGTGGFLTDKRYLLSSTWNAPREAFDDPDQFFEGRGIDGVFLPLHKTFAFLGMKPCESFMVNDVYKNPTIEADFERWDAHLRRLFG